MHLPARLRRLLPVLRRLSVLKTLRFNLHYFGTAGLRHLPVFVSRNVHLSRLGGDVDVSDVTRTGAVLLGFGFVDIFDRRHERAQWANRGTVRFRGTAQLGHGVRVSVQPDGTLDFGDNVHTMGTSTFVCRRSITTGDDCLISWNTTVMDSDLHTIVDAATGATVNPDAPVVLGDRVWIGSGAFVSKGTAVPDDTVIGAGAVVTRTTDTCGTVLAGNPARPVRTDVRWRH